MRCESALVENKACTPVLAPQPSYFNQSQKSRVSFPFPNPIRGGPTFNHTKVNGWRAAQLIRGGEVIYDLDGAQGQGLHPLGGEAGNRLANGEIMPGQRFMEGQSKEPYSKQRVDGC